MQSAYNINSNRANGCKSSFIEISHAHSSGNVTLSLTGTLFIAHHVYTVPM